ncbi:ATP-binding cassette domain-containing protein, partial [Xylella fastidiosa subsp. multiplex]|nr:ATP-binding cassette domain-containing protein [Xylella fastidiosa subsp. multiplex]
MRTTNILGVEGLHAHYGKSHVLQGVSLRVGEAELVTLLGRNGAGKSTLMKVMIGQLDPDEGSCDMPRDTRLGYIAQEAPSGT